MKTRLDGRRLRRKMQRILDSMRRAGISRETIRLQRMAMISGALALDAAYADADELDNGEAGKRPRHWEAIQRELDGLLEDCDAGVLAVVPGETVH
jgi:Asp-tRNA(Asn)/Glu-tRNA(Gln) amidotransferase A subunit family amidase